MAPTPTLAERSAAATATKDSIDLERADALLTLAASPAFEESLAQAIAIYDETEQSSAGINACAFQLVTVMRNLAINAGNERTRIEGRLKPTVVPNPPALAPA